MLAKLLNYDELLSKVRPNCDFWENQLEMPVGRIVQNYLKREVRQDWLASLTNIQLHTLFNLCLPQPPFDLSAQQKRKALADFPLELLNYFLVHHFNHTKLAIAVIEIASIVLTPELIMSLLVKDGKYDKKSLLFVLFNADPQFIKLVYHFDKIQKKGFGSFALKDSPAQ